MIQGALTHLHKDYTIDIALHLRHFKLPYLLLLVFRLALFFHHFFPFRVTNSKQTKVNYLLLVLGYVPSLVTFKVFIEATAGQIEGFNLLGVEAEIRNRNVFSSLASPLKAFNSIDVAVSFGSGAMLCLFISSQPIS